MPDYRLEARRAARRHGLDPNVFERQIGVESVDYSPDVITGRRSSPAGAQGIAQFMPATARGLGVDPLEPLAALDAAAKLMAGYVKQYGGYEPALRAYNAGPGAIEKSRGYTETNNYVKRILQGSDPGSVVGPAKGTSSPAGRGGVGAPGGVVGLSDPGRAGDFAGLASRLLSSPSSVSQGLPVQAPVFAAQPASPVVLQPVLSPAPEQTGPADVSGVLSLVDLLRGSEVGQAAPGSGGGDSVAPGAGGDPIVSEVQRRRTSGADGLWPTGATGKLIGAPHQGTHTLGDWQSDNALDIAVPAGTPMLALQDGVVVKVKKRPQGPGRFAGDQVTVRGANGNMYFYAHGVASVKAGQRISRGEPLGVTGSANGVEHLHFGQMRGDPRRHAR